MRKFLDYRKRRNLVKGSGENSTQFKYEKLQGKGAIRLLIIQPGIEADHIECQLQHNVLLQDIKDLGTSYDALSYQWGEQSPLFPISLDGQEFRVGRSLYDALKTMRPVDTTRLVWIDAICINQGQDRAACNERAIQVKMMQDIYGAATQTVIWLGPEADSSNLAMDFISWQAILEPSRATLKMDTRWKGWTTENDFFYIVREPGYEAVWEALFKLCKRAYWSRMWIIQEIALSSDPVVHCGTKQAKWVDFELVIGLIFAMIEDRVPGAMYFWHLTPLLEDSFPLLLEQQRSQTGGNKDTKWLLATLQKYRGFAATMPQDKVFGFLGLVDGKTRNTVKIDYKAPLRKTYMEIFELLVPRKRWSEVEGEVVTGERPVMQCSFTITVDATGTTCTESSSSPTSRSHGPLNILGCAGFSSSRSNDLPSWLPDWSDQSRPSTIDNITNCRMRASGDLEPCYKIHRGTVLETGGYEFGALRWLSASPAEVTEFSSKTITDNDEALVSSVAHAMIAAVTAAFAGHKFNENTFWRALVFDSFPTQFFFEAPDVWARLEVQVLRDLVAGKELSSAEQELLPSEYIIMLRRTLSGRKFAVSTDGLYVVVPQEATVGDKVCVIWGCDVPMVLGVREDKLVLIGECYCDALLDGSWLDRLSREECEGHTGTFSIY
jgi:hypothetical protein